MNVGTLRNRRDSGFTIVELLIVVVVIAILAAITIVVYTGIQQRTRLSTIKSEISSAAKAMEIARIETNVYPTALPPSVPRSSTTALSLSQTSEGFCINGNDKNNLAIQWRYESSSGNLQEGLCSGQVIAGSEQGLEPNLITNSNFTSGWHLNFQTGAGRTLTNRSGTAGDPYPTRPVLVLQNNATTATSWAVVQNSGINRAEILNGQSYIRSYWVRKVGPYNAGLQMYGLMDGGTQNSTFGTGASTTLTDNWQQVTQSVTAAKDATASNVLYLSTNTPAYGTAGWSLEFQGFEIRKAQ